MTGLLLKYFVLKPKGYGWHAHASRMAMLAYADAVRGHEPEFAEELRKWAEKERIEAYQHG